MSSDSFVDWDDDSIDINVLLTVIESKNFLTRKKWEEILFQITLKVR